MKTKVFEKNCIGRFTHKRFNFSEHQIKEEENSKYIYTLNVIDRKYNFMLVFDEVFNSIDELEKKENEIIKNYEQLKNEIDKSYEF